MSRREARRAALNILFQADVSGLDPLEVLAEREELEQTIDPFTRDLVTGVAADLSELDELIGEHSQDWTVARMASLERNILRLACYELRGDEVPDGAAIDEAVAATKELASPEAAKFVNGILGSIARS